MFDFVEKDVGYRQYHQKYYWHNGHRYWVSAGHMTNKGRNKSDGKTEIREFLKLVRDNRNNQCQCTQDFQYA